MRSDVLNAFFCFADTATIPDTGLAYIEAIAAKTYHTPAYGAVEVTDQKIQNFVTNFHNNTRGQEIAINYDHGVDVAKGNKAAGWIRDARRSDDGKLVLGVEFTEPAKKELKDKEWRYFSLEWEDEWANNDGQVFNDVMVGGGLTNRPIAKGLMPINFSEIFVESLDAEKRFGNTSLPDSAFVYVSDDGKRHLPYKDKDGKIDLVGVRNMLSSTDLPPVVVEKVKALGNRLLGKTGSSISVFDFSETAVNHIFKLSETALLEEITDESKEWEHSEPGTGTPPAPRQDGDGSDDPAIGGGWRRNTPPVADPNDPAYDPDQWNDLAVAKAMGEALREGRNINDWIKETFGKKTTNFGDKSKGGKRVPFELEDTTAHELLRVLDLPVESDGAKVLDRAKVIMGELSQFKQNQDKTEQEKQFAERYPEMWTEHNELMTRDRKNSAKQFSESIGKLRKQQGLGLLDTKTGLSTLAREKVEEVHVKFAEGIATVEDFESAVKAIMHGGLIEFGEIGSGKDDEDVPVYDSNTTTGIAASKKAMSELMQRYMKENNVGPDVALSAVAEKHPELAQAAATAIPG